MWTRRVRKCGRSLGVRRGNIGWKADATGALPAADEGVAGDAQAREVGFDVEEPAGAILVVAGGRF